MTTVTTDDESLSVCPEDDPLTEESTLQKRDFKGPSKTHITTSFYWDQDGAGQGIGKAMTAALQQWVETKNEGLKPQPMILKGYFSQTYVPEHHNANEHFLFGPRLEAGVSQANLNALKKKNITAIYVNTSVQPGRNGILPMWVIGTDGKVRPLK